jgi:hypothetical protein
MFGLLAGLSGGCVRELGQAAGLANVKLCPST